MLVMGLTNVACIILGILFLGNTDSAQVPLSSCTFPWVLIDDMCYMKTDELMTHSEAIDFCSTQSTTHGNATIATFPQCDAFARFAAYLGLAAPTEGNYWVGAKTDFLGSWYWTTFEPLQMGVPFWAHDEGNDDGQDCAAMDRRFYFQLMDDDCKTMKGAVCMVPANGQREEKQIIEFDVIDCPDGTTQVGDHCYYFSHSAEYWERADHYCQGGGHHDYNRWRGELFSPTSCEEFTHMAHHLMTESNHNYWVGGIDVTGYNEWTWVSGEPVPSGVPYWAYGKPDQSGSGHARSHCVKMASGSKYYLVDQKCSWEERYICKVHIV